MQRQAKCTDGLQVLVGHGACQPCTRLFETLLCWLAVCEGSGSLFREQVDICSRGKHTGPMWLAAGNARGLRPAIAHTLTAALQREDEDGGDAVAHGKEDCREVVNLQLPRAAGSIPTQNASPLGNEHTIGQARSAPAQHLAALTRCPTCCPKAWSAVICRNVVAVLTGAALCTQQRQHRQEAVAC